MLYPILMLLMVPAMVSVPSLPAMASCSDVPAPGVQLRRCQLDGGNYQNVDMTGANLRDSSFKRATLMGSTLNEIDGRRVKFVSTNLDGASFSGANLAQADFTSARLNDVSFEGAQLHRARFFRADLRGANFTGASFNETDFLQAQLAGATWIDGVTICAEGSVGRCIPGGSSEAAQAPAGPG